MAHQWLRCNLLASDFPLLTDLFGESVIVKGLDGQSEQNDAQVFYAENIMPTSAGYSSIGLVEQTLEINPATHGYAYQLYPITFPRTADDPFSPTYMFNTLSTLVGSYIYNPGSFSAPTFHAYPAGPSTGGDLSTAQVSGVCYICAPGSGVFHLNSITGLIPDPLIGIVDTAIDGIVGANGLMIAWTSSGVFWSSNQNALDFTPSLVTGAGGGGIGEVKGSIKYCAPIAGGFLIYASQNIVQASYTGNVNFPYKFNEIPGSGGISDQRAITFQDNAGTQFALTQKGIQTVEIGSQTSNILPKITEFLYAGFYEDFDPTTGVFTRVTVDLSIPQDNYTVNFIGGRYLVFSYGLIETTNGSGTVIAKEYKYALILDTLEQRLGKIKFNHVDTMFFDINPLFTNVPFNAGTRIGFLSKEGSLNTIDSQLNNTDAGIIIIGKFQLQRNKGVYHQRTKLEVTHPIFPFGPDITVSIMPTLDGKTFINPPVATNKLNTSGDGIRLFAVRSYGLNISLLIQGPFNLSSLQTDLVLGAQDMRYT